jgi:hypothetical protein
MSFFNLCFRVKLAIPASAASHTGFDMCRMYAVNFTKMRLEGHIVADPSWPTVKCQYGWEFNYTEIPYSTVTSEVSHARERKNHTRTPQRCTRMQFSSSPISSQFVLYVDAKSKKYFLI